MNSLITLLLVPGKTIVFLNFIISDLYPQDDTIWSEIAAPPLLLLSLLATTLLLLLARGNVSPILSFSIDSKSAFSQVILLVKILIWKKV